jgi:PAS domain S-box-containing protein
MYKLKNLAREIFNMFSLKKIQRKESIHMPTEAEKALRESEKKYRIVVDKANDGIIIGQDGIMRFSSSSFAAMLGYEVNEVEGAEFRKKIPPENLGFLLELYQKRLAGEQVPEIYETALLHKNGERIPIEINASIIQFEGKPADLVIMRNITERKQAEEALGSSKESPISNYKK